MTDRQFAMAVELSEKDLEWYAGKAGTYGSSAKAGDDSQLLARQLIGHAGEIAARQWFLDRGHTVEDLFASRSSHGAADLVVDGVDRVAGRRARQNREFARLLERWSKGWGRPRDRLGRLTDDVPPSMPPEHPAFRNLRVEVKTWRAHNWAKYGRSINADQLFRIETKADVVLWVQIEGDALTYGQKVRVRPPSRFRGFDTDAIAPVVARVMGWNLVSDIFAGAKARWSPGLVAQAQVHDELVRSPSSLAPDHRPVQLDLSPKAPSCAHATTVRAGGEVITRKDPGRLCWYCAWDETQHGTPMPQVLMSTGTARFFHDVDVDRVKSSHGRWPFTAPTLPTPAANASRHLAACPHCFPRSLGQS